MLGAEVQHDAEGNPTVEMPGYVPFSTAPVTVSRAETPEESPRASITPDSNVQSPTSSPGVDVNAITENVIETLRRELLIEREQAGGPMDLI